MLKKIVIIPFVIFAFFALFGDFVANEKPLFCQIKGEHYFPAFRQWASDLGFMKNETYNIGNWLQFSEYEKVIKAPIPYSAFSQDEKNRDFISPFAQQNVSSWRYRHWLGTDLLGKDVFAGIISGAKVAFIIGLGATFIAFLLGVFLGVLAGYYGDDKIRLSWLSLLLMTIVSLYTLFIASQIPLFQSFVLFLIVGITLYFLIKIIEKTIGSRLKKLPLKLDYLISSLIDLKRSIPTLVILFVLLVVIEKCNIVHLVLIIGLLSWMTVTLLVRGELKRVKELDYISAAESLGVTEKKLIFKHLLPNALMPIIIYVPHLITSAILAESALSFLGLGLSTETVTWGSLLRAAQENPNAWWLAIFPGLCIFMLVVVLNRMTEKIRKESV